MSDNYIKLYEDFECPVCFYCYEKEGHSNIVNNKTILKKCDFCEARDWLERKPSAHFRRMLEVMPTMKMHRFPEVMRVMSQGLTWDED